MNFIRLAGIIPLGIGLTVLGFLWSSTETFQEQIKARHRELLDAEQTAPLRSTSPPAPGKLKCSNCGSSPQSGEVSPHGDVKCDHCSRWYNVHTA
jgi:hypothetical protein